MTLKNKTILLISPESWHHVFVSKHHYAIHLSKLGNNVFFLNPPSKSTVIKSSNYNNLTIIDYEGFPRGINLMPKFLLLEIFNFVFRKIEKRCKVKFDIIWSFDNSVFFDFSFLTENILCISHIVDLNQDFQTKRAAETADICFGVSTPIVERLKKYNSNSYFINHGFSQSQLTKKIHLPGKNRHKFTYAGNLNMSYLDWQTLYKAVKENTEIDFVFIGPLDENVEEQNKTKAFRSEILNQQNTFFIGTIPANELVSYFNASDALLICYMQEHHLDQANPHKMMEYLGSGTPIISTFTSEYHHLEWIEMSDQNSEWPNMLRNCLLNLVQLKDHELRQKRIEYAKNNSYFSQIERIESLINQL